MDKEVAAIALGIVTILSVFLILQPIIPSTGEKFSELGVLGPTQTIGGYPTDITPSNNTLTLYAYIGNHAGTVELYQYVAKLGTNATIVSNTTAANAPVLTTYSYVLDNGQNTTFPIHLTIPVTGITLRLIFELWYYDTTNSSFVYTGLYNQLWINETT
jgi:uncharacterized membrane protein